MTELEQRTPMQEVLAVVRGEQFAVQIRNALPGNVSVERFQRVTVTAIQQEPKLITVDRASLYRAVVKCAQDGLLPDGREAALTIFGNDAVYMPMIGGFRKIAAEHGWAIDTQVVYEKDEFDYELGVTPRLNHKPPRLDVARGAPIGAYAVATHTDGRKQVEVMTGADIEKVRSVSRAKDRGPWKDWPARMWEKTVGRRIFGKLPLGGRDSDRVARVVEASDSEYSLESEASGMTVDEANAAAEASAAGAAAAANASVPDDGDVEDAIVTELEGVPAGVKAGEPFAEPFTVEEAGTASFAEMAERAQETRKARGER